MSISPSPGDVTRPKPRGDDRAALDDDSRFRLWGARRRIGGDQLRRRLPQRLAGGDDRRLGRDRRRTRRLRRGHDLKIDREDLAGAGIDAPVAQALDQRAAFRQPCRQQLVRPGIAKGADGPLRLARCRNGLQRRTAVPAQPLRRQQAAQHLVHGVRLALRHRRSDHPAGAEQAGDGTVRSRLFDPGDLLDDLARCRRHLGAVTRRQGGGDEQRRLTLSWFDRPERPGDRPRLDRCCRPAHGRRIWTLRWVWS